MKKFHTTIALIILFFDLNAQDIQNGSFENWANITLYEEPQGYSTSNFMSVLTTYLPNVTKIPNAPSGNFAAHLETKISNGDTAFGMLTNASFGQSNLSGGIPFTTKPLTMTAWVKYDIKTGDTAIIATFFKLNGSILGIAFQEITGTDTTFHKITVPVQWPLPAVQPDSMIFAVVSSDPDRNPVDGSWITVDDVRLDNVSFPNSDFETWITYSYDDPLYWGTYNFASVMFPPPYVQKSTDAHHGSFALKITTQFINNNQDTLAHVTNGNIMSDDFSGGMPTFASPRKITGYYKYTPVGNDSALIAIRCYASPSGINDYNDLIKLPAASNYTYFEINIPFFNPIIDTIGIGFASSNIYDGHIHAREGSTLLIDSLNILYHPVGIEETSPTNAVVLFPNPASDYIYVKNYGIEKEGELYLFNNLGKLILREKLTDMIDISHLPTGVYFYRIGKNGGKIHIVK
ncbi:MAG: T9SS type A sorting domain-containing protein [Bacteroidales bacterium]|nr:T9SS type A sorting domain-containing protein [Bacteroidales bacterium]